MNTGGKAPACVPTWKGHVETTKDALLVFEACFNGTLSHCFRRPHDRERIQLIVSGNVFVYEEATSGIKRWTDGIPWSPSRILTNFLIYRQLNSPFPPGEKKRATKRSQRPTKPGEPYPTSSSNTTPKIEPENDSFSPGSPTASKTKEEDGSDKDANRGLVGSLVDSYEFKENGLLKKTMTVTVNNVQHHLVSYYSLDDAKYNLKTPRDDLRLKDLHIRDALMNQPKFKFPNLDDAGDGTFEGIDPQHHGYPTYFPNGYDGSRLYQQLHAGHSASIVYPTGAYAPTHPPSTNTGYIPTTSTSGAYAPLASANPYLQQQPHSHQYHYHQQTQPYTQYPTHAQQTSHYQAHHYPVPQTQLPEQQQQHSQETSSSSLPRTSDRYYNVPQTQSNTSQETYAQDAASAAPPADNLLQLSQAQQAPTWQPGYPQPWSANARPDGYSYPSYRPG